MGRNKRITAPASVEKEYPYRYSRFATIFIMLVGAAGSYLLIWATTDVSVTDNLGWFLLVCFVALLFFCLFLYGASILVVGIIGKPRLFITKDEIYIPSVWKLNSYAVILFAGITRIQVERVELVIRVGGKKYRIARAWLPKGAFDEIADIVIKRAPVGIN